MKEQIQRFKEALLSVDRLTARTIIMESRRLWPDFQTVERLVIPALEDIGAGWEQGAISLSQVYMGGRLCEALVDEILPPESVVRKELPKTALAVLDDYHFLGKRIVYAVLRAAGWEIIDYGRVEPAEAVRRVLADRIEILLISVLMLPSALRVREVAEKLREAGSAAKVIVGGAPFRLDQELWREVGADAMGTTATDCLKLISALTAEKEG